MLNNSEMDIPHVRNAKMVSPNFKQVPILKMRSIVQSCIGNHKATCGAQSHFSGDTKNLFTARDLTVGRFSINTKCAYSNLENFGKIILALFSIDIKRYLRF